MNFVCHVTFQTFHSSPFLNISVYSVHVTRQAVQGISYRSLLSVRYTLTKNILKSCGLSTYTMILAFLHAKISFLQYVKSPQTFFLRVHTQIVCRVEVTPEVDLFQSGMAYRLNSADKRLPRLALLYHQNLGRV